jgi:hypothetical protein
VPASDDRHTRSPQGDAGWSTLAVGDRLNVVKRTPNGSEVARYLGTAIAPQDGEGWVVVQVIWTSRCIDVAGLTFAPGDVHAQWFSPGHDFNAFAIHAPSGEFKGWYANVTHPAELDRATSPPTLAWRDLYLDVVALPDTPPIVCDEDELADSGLLQSDPRLHTRILRARDEILDRLARRLSPFGARENRAL